MHEAQDIHITPAATRMGCLHKNVGEIIHMHVAVRVE